MQSKKLKKEKGLKIKNFSNFNRRGQRCIITKNLLCFPCLKIKKKKEEENGQ